MGGISRDMTQDPVQDPPPFSNRWNIFSLSSLSTFFFIGDCLKIGDEGMEDGGQHSVLSWLIILCKVIYWLSLPCASGL
jgi:hypothetical protein